MLLTEERQTLCERCCDDAADRGTGWSIPLTSTGTGVPPILGTASALSPRARLAFVATNLPYFAAAVWIFASHPIPWDRGTLCCTALCASAGFHGGVISALGAVSTYWHGAQCQLQPRCCLWLYCYDPRSGSSRLHSVRWLKRLVLADVGCSMLTILVGLACFGPSRTLCVRRALPLLGVRAPSEPPSLACLSAPQLVARRALARLSRRRRGQAARRLPPVCPRARPLARPLRRGHRPDRAQRRPALGRVVLRCKRRGQSVVTHWNPPGNSHACFPKDASV